MKNKFLILLFSFILIFSVISVSASADDLDIGYDYHFELELDKVSIPAYYGQFNVSGSLDHFLDGYTSFDFTSLYLGYKVDDNGNLKPADNWLTLKLPSGHYQEFQLHNGIPNDGDFYLTGGSDLTKGDLHYFLSGSTHDDHIIDSIIGTWVINADASISDLQGRRHSLKFSVDSSPAVYTQLYVDNFAEVTNLYAVGSDLKSHTLYVHQPDEEYWVNSIITVHAGTYDTDVVDWLRDNCTPKVTNTCDGTQCSALDFNDNGICDTCGKTLTYNATYNFNGYRLTLPPALDIEQYPYLWLFYFEANNSYILYASTSRIENYVGTSLLYYESTGQHLRFQYNNDAWSSMGPASNHSTTTSMSIDDLVWTSHPIYERDSDYVVMQGDPNFMTPLSKEIMQVATDQFHSLTLPSLARVMMILLLSGVGLLALVVVLSLFGKRSLISRK